MARDKLLFQVELLPPSASNVKSVSAAIDKLTEGQKDYNRTLQKGSNELEEQKKNYKSFRQEIRKIKTAVGEAENQSRFFNESNEDGIKKIQAQANQLENLRQEINQANLSTEDRIRLQDKLQTRMRSVQLSQQKVRTGWKGMSHATKQGNQLLLSTGRILQDLPFGFIGISNNIEQTALEFRRATEDGAGFTGALSKMGKSLMGSGGLLFLLGSALPFAMTVASNGFIGFKDLLGDSEQKVQELKGSIKTLVDDISDLRGIQGDDPLGIQDMEARLSSVRQLLDSLDHVIDKQEKRNRLDNSAVNLVKQYGSEGLDPQVEHLDKIIQKELDRLGLTEEQFNKLKQQEGSLQRQLNTLIELGRVSEEEAFQIKQLERANRLIDQFELGIRETTRSVKVGNESIDQRIRTVDALRAQRQELLDVQRRNQQIVEDTTDAEARADALAKLRATDKVLKNINDTLNKIPEKPTVDFQLGELPTFEAQIDTDLGLSFDDAAQFGKEQRKQLEELRKQRTKFLMESRKQAFDIRKELSTDVIALQMSTNRQLREIDKRAAELGLEDHRVVENLKTEVTRRAAEKRRKLELEKERQLQKAKMGVVKHAANFIGSINKALAEKSRTVALIELAIQKGLKIAQVWTEAQQKTGELQMESQVAAAKSTAAALSGNFLKAGQFAAAATALSSQIATVQSTAAQTSTLIAATGIGEGVGLFTGGGSSGGGGGSATGGGRGGSQGSGFNPSSEEGIKEQNRQIKPASDRQAITPGMGTKQEIVIRLEGDLSDEMISLKSENGRKRRESRSIKIVSD